jgi:hypothetical protein
VFLATHGWWPWLLTFAFVLIVIGCVIAYFVKKRPDGTASAVAGREHRRADE